MKYRVGNLYYIPGGRYISGKDKAGMNVSMIHVDFMV
jgi:hypothetical protein